MTTLALKSTIVAGTGTGKTFDAYNMGGNTAVFRELAPVGVAGLIQLGRTEAKPSKDYAGAARGVVKLTRQYADTQGVLRPAVGSLTTSIPAFLTDIQKDAFVTELVLLALEQASRDALAKLIIPQS